MMVPNNFGLVDLNSDCEMGATSSLDMVRLDVVVLALFERLPFTDSVTTIDLVVKSMTSVTIGGDNVLSGIESFWTDIWNFAQFEQAIIITGRIESVLSSFWRHEPAFVDIAEVISLTVRSCECGSDLVFTVHVICLVMNATHTDLCGAMSCVYKSSSESIMSDITGIGGRSICSFSDEARNGSV